MTTIVKVMKSLEDYWNTMKNCIPNIPPYPPGKKLKNALETLWPSWPGMRPGHNLLGDRFRSIALPPRPKSRLLYSMKIIEAIEK